ncbi:YjjG family noncanonical pyrimidine nucleotidase [Algibacter mikhailovii]|uniref:Noncanonical pyrimidine nucleotidase, YjjG family protein n=1 Tax=Algibacter mikhailovii TaxID=425498 RepID=A0A918V7P0_9FLAO|nr:YjjG family noncanonical pyrimidine nucleotidase [Algibacter mikhailovii]GGZ79280.1 noncanonical pyrimidine nucleotidase, YjjG family protein [Algibacter mikhailovii]
MKINNIKDVFFDLDHTLWDFDKNSALTFEKIFSLNNIEVPLQEFVSHYEPINLKYWKLYREGLIEKEDLRFVRLNETFQAINYKIEEHIIYKLSEDYITYLTSFNYLFENTHDILDYLSLNYNLHIITNGFDEVQHKKLTNSNIIKYFKTVTNSEMVGVKKPNPKIFKYALNSAKANISQSIMIGDSYEADILGAMDVGMNVVFFDTRKTKISEDVIQIDALSALKRYL